LPSPACGLPSLAWMRARWTNAGCGGRSDVSGLMAAARKGSRWGHRDATMILIGYRHGLRASELCDLRWSQVELSTGVGYISTAARTAPPGRPGLGGYSSPLGPSLCLNFDQQCMNDVGVSPFRFSRACSYPPNRAAAPPGFRCERTFSKWHSLWRCPMLLNPRHLVRA
jgi:hypothetical protein